MQKSRETEIIRMIKVVHLRIEQYANEALTKYDVTAAQMDVLQCVMEHRDSSMISSDIHRQMHLSKANISNIIKKLRAKGFLEFVPNPADDRQKHIVVTQKARNLDSEMGQCFKELQKKLYGGFTREEEEGLKLLLEKLFVGITPCEEERRDIL